MSLEQLVGLSIVVLFLWFVIRHHQIRNKAYHAALMHTRQHGVVLLDESLTLASIRVVQSSSSLFALKREFHFEFSSLGDVRYRGVVIFMGAHQKEIKLQAYKTVFEGEPLD